MKKKSSKFWLETRNFHDAVNENSKKYVHDFFRWFLFSQPMVNGLDHSVPEFTPSQISTSLDNDNASSTAPYAAAAAIISSSSAVTKSTTVPNQPNKLLTSVEQNAVQVVRSHVESLKHPGKNDQINIHKCPFW